MHCNRSLQTYVQQPITLTTEYVEIGTKAIKNFSQTGEFAPGLDTNTHPHTHTHPFNGPLSGTTQVNRYQKCKTNLEFTEARDSGWQWHQLGHNAGLHLAPDRQPHPTTHVFYRPDALPAAQPTASKH